MCSFVSIFILRVLYPDWFTFTLMIIHGVHGYVSKHDRSGSFLLLPHASHGTREGGSYKLEVLLINRSNLSPEKSSNKGYNV